MGSSAPALLDGDNMAFDVKFYNFPKKTNSTAIPGEGVSAFTASCVLKDASSIENPVIIYRPDAITIWTPKNYNYAYIAEFSRYYFVTSRTWEKGTWIFALNTDILGTYRAAILLSDCYVLRATYEYDGTIVDPLYPAKEALSSYKNYWGRNTTQYSPWTNTYNSGTLVVGIINADDNTMGSVSYYFFTPAQFSVLKSYLMGSTTWTGIMSTNPDLGENLYKSLFDPFQYISSVQWFPFSVPLNNAYLITSLKFGWWDLTNISCYRMVSPIYTMPTFIKVSCHPQAGERGVYLNCAPYSKYHLHAPPFGDFYLDASLFSSANFDANGYYDVSVTVYVDFISGLATLWLQIGSPLLDALTVTAQLSIQVQLAQIYSQNTAGSVISAFEQTVISAAKAIISGQGNEPMGMPVGDALASGSIHMMQTGVNGSLSQYLTDFYIESIHYTVVDDDVTDKGRPVCQVKRLATLVNGYVQTMGAHIAINGTEEEINAVNQMLDGGLFLE